MVNGFPDRMSATDIARALGLSKQAVSTWDCPSHKPVGGAKYRTYSLPNVVAWRMEKLRDELLSDGARVGSKGVAVAVQRKREAEAALKEAQAGEMVDPLATQSLGEPATQVNTLIRK